MFHDSVRHGYPELRDPQSLLDLWEAVWAISTEPSTKTDYYSNLKDKHEHETAQHEREN